MTIRFAAANTGPLAARRSPACRPIARAMAARAMERVGNDNAPLHRLRSADDELLHAALRHFAEHGLGAARIAHTHAQAACAVEDQHSYDWWLEITRRLDRRLAAELERLSARPA